MEGSTPECKQNVFFSLKENLQKTDTVEHCFVEQEKKQTVGEKLQKTNVTVLGLTLIKKPMCCLRTVLLGPVS